LIITKYTLIKVVVMTSYEHMFHCMWTVFTYAQNLLNALHINSKLHVVLRDNMHV